MYVSLHLIFLKRVREKYYITFHKLLNSSRFPFSSHLAIILSCLLNCVIKCLQTKSLSIFGILWPPTTFHSYLYHIYENEKPIVIVMSVRMNVKCVTFTSCTIISVFSNSNDFKCVHIHSRGNQFLSSYCLKQSVSLLPYEENGGGGVKNNIFIKKNLMMRSCT